MATRKFGGSFLASPNGRKRSLKERLSYAILGAGVIVAATGMAYRLYVIFGTASDISGVASNFFNPGVESVPNGVILLGILLIVVGVLLSRARFRSGSGLA